MARRARRIRPKTKIAAARIKANLTQEDLARMAGLTRRTLQRLERGETEPTVSQFLRLAHALDCSPSVLVEPEWRPPDDTRPSRWYAP